MSWKWKVRAELPELPHHAATGGGGADGHLELQELPGGRKRFGQLHLRRRGGGGRDCRGHDRRDGDGPARDRSLSFPP